MLAFPCNQFAYQERQAATEVEACVRRKYGVEFHMMQKVLGLGLGLGYGIGLV